MTDPVVLDADQLLAAHVPASTRQLIVAGPGSGKTEVVGALVSHLVELGADQPSEILVLSFSRAATGAVLSRLSKDAKLSGVVQVRTIDSLARRIIIDSGVEVPLGFEEGIATATQILLDAQRTADSLDFAHIVIDEAQDLGPRRAGLILQILGDLNPHQGFTVLGDPLQSIYRFREKSDSFSWKGFLSDLEKIGAHSTVELKGKYRFSQGDPLRASKLSDELRFDLPASKRAEVIGRFLPSLSRMPIESVARFVPQWPGSTAVLARNNGRVLAISDFLQSVGVDIAPVRSAQDQVCANWLAELAEHAGTQIEREEFQDFLHGRTDVTDDAWQSLRRFGGGGQRVSVEAIVSRLASGSLPHQLELQAQSAVCASTIHRAKGLEFDNVLIHDPEALISPSRAESGFEVEEAFVALTRARSRLARLVIGDQRTVLRDRSTGRWFEPGYKSWQTRAFEIRGRDTRSGLPMEGQDHLQTYLQSSVAAGDTVTFRMDPRRSSMDFPVYEVQHGGVVVSRTNEDFGRDLSARIGGARRTGKLWPELGEGHVESLESVGGVPGLDYESRSIRAGLWLGIRVFGLVELKW